jgi:hypothetical protein
MPSRVPSHRPEWMKIPTAQPRRDNGPCSEWADFINSRLWRRCSKSYLARNPLCVECKKANRLEPATQTHHTRGHDPEYRLDESTFMALCQRCHSSITMADMNAKMGKRGGG